MIRFDKLYCKRNKIKVETFTEYFFVKRIKGCNYNVCLDFDRPWILNLPFLSMLGLIAAFV